MDYHWFLEHGWPINPDDVRIIERWQQSGRAGLPALSDINHARWGVLFEGKSVDEATQGWFPTPEPSTVIRGDFLGSTGDDIYFGAAQMSCLFNERLRQFDRDAARGANAVLMMAQWAHRDPYPWACNIGFNFRSHGIQALARTVDAAVARNLDVWLVLWDRGLQEYHKGALDAIVQDAHDIYSAMGVKLAGILPFFEIDEPRDPETGEPLWRSDHINLYRELRAVCGDVPLAIHWQTTRLYKERHREHMVDLLRAGCTHVFAQHPRGQTPEQIAEQTRQWVSYVPAEMVYVYAEACAGNNHSQDSPERRDACAQAAGDALKSKGHPAHSFNGVNVNA